MPHQPCSDRRSAPSGGALTMRATWRSYEIEDKAWSYGGSAPVCFYCGIRITWTRPQHSMGIRKRTCDHLIPKSAGGPNLYENRVARSEEHTSDLQSLMRNSYAVFFLKNK